MAEINLDAKVKIRERLRPERSWSRRLRRWRTLPGASVRRGAARHARRRHARAMRRLTRSCLAILSSCSSEKPGNTAD